MTRFAAHIGRRLGMAVTATTKAVESDLRLCFPGGLRGGSQICATLAALVALALATSLSATSSANQMTVFSCHAPNGEVVSSDGWTIARTGQAYMYVSNTCAANNSGTMMLEVGANPSGYPNLAGVAWIFAAPTWATIAKYTIHVPDSYTYFSYSGIVGVAAIQASDETDPMYDYRNQGAGSWGAMTVERTPPDTVKSLAVNASCDGEGGPCPSATRIARIDLSSSAVVLNDSTIPSMSDLSGSLVSSSPLRGTVEASFTATNKGPGVYSAWLVVDGEAQPPVGLDTNNGMCVDLGQTADKTRSFSHPDPCAEMVSSGVAFDTTALPDGQHTIKLNIDDASGNTVTAYDATVSTHNAPAIVTAPSISGSALVGASLSGTLGTFSVPQGAGALSGVQGEWLRCSDAAAAHCSAITGQTGTAYTPTAADIGYYIVYQNTVSDKDGITVADSQPTLAVSQSAKETGGSGSGQSNAGGSSGSTSGPSGSGSSAAGGAGGSAQGLTLNLVSAPTLGSTSPWQLSLKVSPHKVRRGTTIRLSGSVTTSPRPTQGKLVYLKARSVERNFSGRGRKDRRSVRYGKWIAFMQLRTNSNGGFTASYKFRFGGRHVYQFQAVAPQEGGYLNTTGASRTVAVTEG